MGNSALRSHLETSQKTGVFQLTGKGLQEVGVRTSSQSDAWSSRPAAMMHIILMFSQCVLRSYLVCDDMVCVQHLQVLSLACCRSPSAAGLCLDYLGIDYLSEAEWR